MDGSARPRSGRSKRRSPSSKAGTARCWRRPGCRPSPPRCSPSCAAGDEMLIVDSVYRPTRRFCDNVLKRLGVNDHLLRPADRRRHRKADHQEDEVVFTESPGSQTFEVQDIPAIAAAAHEAGAVVILDNTWATPLYFKPFAHGADVSIQAATKYIVGHADAMLGAITTSEKTVTRRSPRRMRTLVFARARGRLSRLAGLAQPRRAARAASEVRARTGALAGGAARSGAGDPPRPSRRSRARALEAATSPAPPACSRSC